MLPWEFYQNGIEKLFEVIDKDGRTLPFKLNDVQLRVLKELARSDIVLKSRQQGMSTLILALFTIDFLTVENARCVVISHEQKATSRLFDRVKFFLEAASRNFPGEEPFKLKYNSRYELENVTKNSKFYIGTAGARAFGHGDTINNLHVSELSRYPEPEKLLSGLLQAVPKGGRVIIETTANGYNYFYRLWNTSSRAQNPAFLTHFVPWFETKEYALPVLYGVEFVDGHPTYGDELLTINKFHLSKEQMMWRRWQIDRLNGDLDKFKESYPSTAEEAFIQSGNNVWSPSLLSNYMLKTKDPRIVGNMIGYNPIMIDKNERGYLSIFKEPQEFHQYVIGADVSEGKIVAEGDEQSETDFSCAQVIDRNTFEQVAVWHGKIDPDMFGRQLEMLGNYYNRALIAVERNSMGISPLTVLRDLSYPNLYYREKFGLMNDKRTTELGWVTDMITKDILVNDATQLLRDKRLYIYDTKTVDEMMSFVRDSRGRPGAASGAHDDRVMSFLIAVKMLGQPMQTVKGNDIERSDYELMGEVHWVDGVPFDKNGMPVSPEQAGGELPFDF